MPPQRLDHHLGLIRRHDAVFGALEEDDRAAQPVGMRQRRALSIEIRTLRVGADQPVEVARLEFVRVAGERGDVADAVIAGAALEHGAAGQGRQNGIAAGAAAGDDTAHAVGQTSTSTTPQPPSKRSR